MCTCATEPSGFPGNQRGSLMIGVLALLLMVSAFLLMAAHGVVADTDAATRHRARMQAFYVAEAGISYGLAQADADTSWSGLAAPGRNCMEGNFNVTVSHVNDDGSALPAYEKRLVSTGTVNGATSVVSQIIQLQ